MGGLSKKLAMLNIMALVSLGLTGIQNEGRAATVKREVPAQAPAASVPVVKVTRDRLSDDGVLKLEQVGGVRTVRLPASIGFEPGNTFSVDGMRIRVEHLSSNSAKATFDLGKRAGFFKDNPLYTQEEEFLLYAALFLFPKIEGAGYREALKLWIEDMDFFLKLHQHDTQVIRIVQSFVLNYASHPPKGYLVGDQLWDFPREVQTWNQFYEFPYYYDLEGFPLTVDGKPMADEPRRLSREELKSAELLYRRVLRNLEYTHEGLKALVMEGEFGSVSSAYAEVACARRSYLTLKLLQTGLELWEKMKK